MSSGLFSKVKVGDKVRKNEGGLARHQGYEVSLYRIDSEDEKDEAVLIGKVLGTQTVAFEGYK